MKKQAIMKCRGNMQRFLGAAKLDSGAWFFRVWAPRCARVELKLVSADGESLRAMDKDDDGYFSIEVPGLAEYTRYSYVLDGIKERADSASRFQPQGVSGPSALINAGSYHWRDAAWKGISLSDMIFYEAHIGTFTPEGTFAAAGKKIPYLKKLGITCLEIMPVAQFPGTRNWGYDGVGLYAVHNSYGGPQELKKLVDACHSHGMAACLDVVYNHFGPEGNYLNDFGPYFTNTYHTPWGGALNFDGAGSDHVRRFIIENALYWIREYHFDALRLDAVHGIYDFSALHILQELQNEVNGCARLQKRSVHIIAESDLNDSRIIRQPAQGGYGLSGQWSDDFHHAVHACLTGEHAGYYQDFRGIQDIAKALSKGFVYDGVYSSFRQRRHGNSVADIPPEKLVVCVQNHDQVGNRAFGERLSTLVSFEKQKIAAALLIAVPQTPLIFMGQEYGEEAPFQYFVDHQDPGLIQAVQEGRKKEFAAFGWNEIPDPKSEKTFLDSKLRWNIRAGSRQYYMFQLYRDLIALRKKIFSRARLAGVWHDASLGWIAFAYAGKQRKRFGVVVSLSEQAHSIVSPFGSGRFREMLHTNSTCYGGASSLSLRHASGKVTLPPCGALIGQI